MSGPLDARREWAAARAEARRAAKDEWDSTWEALMRRFVQQAPTPCSAVRVTTPNGGICTVVVGFGNPVSPRIDTVYQRRNTDSVVYEVGVITGTPARTPAPPPLPDWAEPLAHVRVPAGSWTVTNADITPAEATP